MVIRVRYAEFILLPDIVEVNDCELLQMLYSIAKLRLNNYKNPMKSFLFRQLLGISVVTYSISPTTLKNRWEFRKKLNANN